MRNPGESPRGSIQLYPQLSASQRGHLSLGFFQFLRGILERASRSAHLWRMPCGSIQLHPQLSASQSGHLSLGFFQFLRGILERVSRSGAPLANAVRFNPASSAAARFAARAFSARIFPISQRNFGAGIAFAFGCTSGECRAVQSSFIRSCPFRSPGSFRSVTRSSGASAPHSSGEVPSRRARFARSSAGL